MKHLYKIVQGNHTCLAAESDEREAQLRADGYMLAEELWPADPVETVKRAIRMSEEDMKATTGIFDATLGSPKRRGNGRNSA